MGGKAAGVGVELPLSTADRERIICDLTRLGQDISGTNPGRLVDLIAESLSVGSDDLFSSDGLSDFAAEPDVVARPEGEQASVMVEQALRRLLSAANALAGMLASEFGDPSLVWREEHPWHPHYDPLNFALSRILNNAVAPCNDARATLVDTIRRLHALGIDTKTSESFYNDEPARWLVRSVMYYRHEQNLPVTVDWLRSKGSRKHAHRQDDEMSPITATCQLVAAVATAFKLSAPVKHLAHLTTEYRAFYIGRSPGHPVISDTNSPLRYAR